MSTQRCASTVAGLGGDRRRQLVAALGDQLGGAVKHFRPRVLREVSRLESFVGGLDRPLDQRFVTLRDPADDAAIVRALHLVPLARLPPLAGGEELVVGRLYGLRRHRALLSNSVCIQSTPQPMQAATPQR